MLADMIGWVSAFILVMTISRQVYSQWRSKSVQGISHWLFIGQLAASAGFTAYSFLVDNWVFVFANFFIFLTAVAGQYVYLRNKRLSKAVLE
jgi:MtN3 and saliva related transmembrane protein